MKNKSDINKLIRDIEIDLKISKIFLQMIKDDINSINKENQHEN